MEGLGDASVSYVTSQRADFHTCVLYHSPVGIKKYQYVTKLSHSFPLKKKKSQEKAPAQCSTVFLFNNIATLRSTDLREASYMMMMIYMID